MELLLHLIQVNKIDIYDIPIAALTEQYMAYLAEMRRFDIEVASEFLVMAATLLLIKSRMLLPKTPKETEEDEETDPREELVRRIVEYQRYKKVSLEMAERAEEESRFVGRAPAELPVRLAPPQGLSVNDLWEAFRRVLEVKRELTIPEAIVAHEEYRVEDQMQMIVERLLASEDGATDFEDLFLTGTRDELVATFLALLELIRRRIIVVRQPMLFGPIRVEQKCLALPKKRVEVLADLRGALEAVLFAGGDPLTEAQLLEILETDAETLRGLLASLEEELSARGSGLMLKETAGGWQMVTRPELFKYVERLSQEINRKLSRAAMETLSIIAFKQPVTKLEIEQIRGVQHAERVLAQLISRELITEVGRKNVIGRPIQYGTTETFLRAFGLKNLDDLPILPEPDMEQLSLPMGEDMTEDEDTV